MSTQPTTDQRPPAQATGGKRYTNGALTAVALLLGVIAAQHTVGLPGVGQALAQGRGGSSPRPSMGMPNPEEQRERMIAVLQAMDARLAKLEAKLSGPIDVRVKEMPEMKSDTGGAPE